MKKFIFLILLITNKSLADYGVSFVRIVCDQDINYLQVQFESVSGSYVMVSEDSEPREKKRIYDLWQKNGFYKPSAFSYECKLKNHIYKVSTTQPKPSNGHCGVQPNIKFSLTEDNSILVDQVWFGPTCNGEPYLEKLEMYNPGEVSNLKRREMYIWLTPDAKMRSDWVLLTDIYKDIEKEIPLNQSKLEEQARLVKQRNR